MKVPKMKNPPPENSMAQANANYDRWKDARDPKEAFRDWEEKTAGKHFIVNRTACIDFALYFAQRCGVVFTESINHIHLKDGVDVYKALSDFVMEKNRTLPMHDADWLEFAQYFAKRWGVQLERSKDE